LSELYASLMEVIRNRRSIRGFDLRQVPNDDILRIIEAGRWAPSGANIQPWEFLVIRDRELVKRLGEVLKSEKDLILKADPEFPIMGREYHDTIGNYILVLGDSRLIEAFPHVTPDIMDWTLCSSLAAAVMQMHLAATSLGLGSVWLTIHRETEEQIRKLFNIPDVYRVYTVFPVGYPAKKRKSYRRDLEEIVHRDGFDIRKYRSDEVIDELLSKKARAYLMSGKEISLTQVGI
jgi:5,6-dimethylbenzimidazole synthase